MIRSATTVCARASTTRRSSELGGWTEAKRIEPAGRVVQSPRTETQLETKDWRKRFGFTQVVTSPPGRLVFVSGQVGLDRDLKLVGEGDVAVQAEQRGTA